MPVKTAGGAGTNQYRARGVRRQRLPADLSQPTPDLLRQFQDVLRQQVQPVPMSPSKTLAALRQEFPDLRIVDGGESTVNTANYPFDHATILQHKASGQAVAVSWALIQDVVKRHGHVATFVKGWIARTDSKLAAAAQVDNLELTSPPHLSKGSRDSCVLL